MPVRGAFLTKLIKITKLIKRQGFHTVLREGWSEQMGQKGGREGCWWWGVGKCKLTIYIHVVVRSGALVALITLYEVCVVCTL